MCVRVARSVFLQQAVGNARQVERRAVAVGQQHRLEAQRLQHARLGVVGRARHGRQRARPNRLDDARKLAALDARHLLRALNLQRVQLLLVLNLGLLARHSLRQIGLGANLSGLGFQFGLHTRGMRTQSKQLDSSVV